MRRSHTLCHMSVSRMGKEELPLCTQSRTNVLLPIDIFLAAVHYANVACTQKVSFWTPIGTSFASQHHPHLCVEAATCFPGFPLHRCLHPSGPALLSPQWCVHLRKSNWISAKWYLLIQLLCLCLPCGSTSLAILRASELARSVLAGVTARIKQLSLVMNCNSMSLIWCSISMGWSPTGTLVIPGRSIRVRFSTESHRHKSEIVEMYKSDNLLMTDNKIIWVCVQKANVQ